MIRIARRDGDRTGGFLHYGLGGTMRAIQSEQLERRRLMAFTAAIDAGRVLVITGTDAVDTVQFDIRYLVESDGTAGNDYYQFDVRDVPDYSYPAQGTLVGTFDPDDFDSVRVDLGGGDDTCEFLARWATPDGTPAPDPVDLFEGGGFVPLLAAIDCGAGNDRVSLSFEGNNVRTSMLGGAGDDTLRGGHRSDTIVGGAGRNEIFAGEGDNHVDLATDADAGSYASSNGGRDTILGSPFADHISSAGGDDYLIGGSGDDTIFGGEGNDTLTGGAGRNRLYGAEGNDRLKGSNGRDFLHGGAGSDRLYGNGGNDYLDGGGNTDRIWAGSGDDSVMGGSSIDRLYGEAGNDTLIGGTGNDYLFGGDGADFDGAPDPDAGDLLDSIEGAALFGPPTIN